MEATADNNNGDGKDIEVFAASEEDVRKASQIIKVHISIMNNSSLYFLICRRKQNKMHQQEQHKKLYWRKNAT